MLIPERNDDGKIESDPAKWNEYELDREGVLGALYNFDDVMPKTPSFVALISNGIPLARSGQKKEICPVGLMNEDSTNQLISIEAMCENYGCLPFEPGTSLESQPSWVVDAFITISVAKSKYYDYKMEVERMKNQRK